MCPRLVRLPNPGPDASVGVGAEVLPSAGNVRRPSEFSPLRVQENMKVGRVVYGARGPYVKEYPCPNPSGKAWGSHSLQSPGVWSTLSMLKRKFQRFSGSPYYSRGGGPTRQTDSSDGDLFSPFQVSFSYLCDKQSGTGQSLGNPFILPLDVPD